MVLIHRYISEAIWKTVSPSKTNTNISVFENKKSLPKIQLFIIFWLEKWQRITLNALRFIYATDRCAPTLANVLSFFPLESTAFIGL